MATLIGTAGNDTLTGTTGNDSLSGGAGNDTLHGGAGEDIARFSGDAAEYRFGVSNGYITVTDLHPSDGNDGSDVLSGIELLEFADRTYSASTEIRGNSVTAGGQRDPVLAILDSGDFVIAWQTPDEIGGYFDDDIAFQVFDVSGVPIGSQQRANGSTIDDQAAPAIAPLPGGGFLLVWESWGSDLANSWGIIGRRFDGSGAALGSEFAVNSSIAGDQFQPDVATLGGGGFVVAWEGPGEDTISGASAVYARRFDASGTPAGTDFRVNTYTPNPQGSAAVAPLAGGGFVVVWQSFGQDGSGYGVYAQIFNATGTAVGSEFRVNTTTGNDQEAPAVAGLGNGDFVVVWESFPQDGSGSGIYLQRFTEVGFAIGSERAVNTITANTQGSPSIAALADGGYVVSWESFLADTDQDAISAQRFAANGNAVGTEFRVNTSVILDQDASDVAAHPDGGFIVAWDDDETNVEGAPGEVYLQRFDAGSNFIGWPTLTGTPGDDTLDLGGTGGTRALGLAGNDVYRVDSVYDEPIEAPGEGTDSVFSSIGWELGANLENIYLTGTASANAAGNDLDNEIGGNQGNNFLDGGDGEDTAVFPGAPSGYRIGFTGDSIIVTDADPTDGDDRSDTLVGIEHLRFEGSGGGDELVVLRDDATEFLVNTTTAGPQDDPAIARLSDGGFVVTWQSTRTDQSATDIYARRYDASGFALGDEFRVNTFSADDQTAPVVAALGNGSFVVAWQSLTQDGSGQGIYAQRFDGNGVAQGAESLVNTTAAGSQEQPALVKLKGGGYVIAWQSEGQDGSGSGIYAQLFAANGMRVGGEFRLNSTTQDAQGVPALAALASGGFVAVWESQDGSGKGLFAQRFDAAGSALGAEFQVATTTASDQSAGSIAGLAGGGFVVSWQSALQDGSGNGVYAQRFGASGDRLGAEFLVNASVTLLDQSAPELVALSNGGFVIAWQSQGQDGSGSGVYYRRYDADGVVRDNDRLNTAITDDQGSPALAATNDGGFIAAWVSQNQDGDRGGIYAQRLTAGGEPLPVPLVGGDDSELIDLSNTQNGAASGGKGNDIFVVNNSGDLISEKSGEGIDTVQASVSWVLRANFENLVLSGSAPLKGTGNALNNVLVGNTGANNLSGAGGRDTLNGGAGADTLAGGKGGDLYYVDNAADRVIETSNPAFRGREEPPDNAAQDADTIVATVGYALTAYVENLVLVGSGDIDGKGNNLANLIDGNEGDNSLAGGAGNDTLTGSSGADTLAGGAGNDTYLVESDDKIVELADGGTDTVSSETSWVLANNLESLVLAGTGNFNGTGNGADNRITGNEGVNTLDGRAGNDTLDGGLRADSLIGGTGNDLFLVTVGDVVVEEAGGGVDTIQGPYNWTLPANVEYLTLTGTNKVNGTGNSLANRLLGNGSANRLEGLSGNDTLGGNGGNDTLAGGDGADAFRFDTPLSAANNKPVVSDFTPGIDKLQLDDDIFAALNAAQSSTLSAAQFHAAPGATAAQDASDRIVYDTTTGTLYYDSDGAGGAAPIAFATLGGSPRPALGAADFQIVG